MNSAIVRVFRARVLPGRQEEFKKFFLSKALANVRAQGGLLSVTVGLPLDDSPTEFMMTTTWRDLDALKGFAGEHWREAVIDPDEAHLLQETFVDHYEAVSTQS